MELEDFFAVAVLRTRTDETGRMFNPTRIPALVAMFTNASRLNISILPFSCKFDVLLTGFSRLFYKCMQHIDNIAKLGDLVGKLFN